jgi:hypothetical protein
MFKSRAKIFHRIGPQREESYHNTTAKNFSDRAKISVPYDQIAASIARAATGSRNSNVAYNYGWEFVLNTLIVAYPENPCRTETFICAPELFL